MSKLKVLLFCLGCILFCGSLVVLGLAWLNNGGEDYWQTVQRYGQNFLAIVAFVSGIAGVVVSMAIITTMVFDDSK